MDSYLSLYTGVFKKKGPPVKPKPKKNSTSGIPLAPPPLITPKPKKNSTPSSPPVTPNPKPQKGGAVDTRKSLLDSILNFKQGTLKESVKNKKSQPGTELFKSALPSDGDMFANKPTELETTKLKNANKKEAIEHNERYKKSLKILNDSDDRIIQERVFDKNTTYHLLNWYVFDGVMNQKTPFNLLLSNYREKSSYKDKAKRIHKEITDLQKQSEEIKQHLELTQELQRENIDIPNFVNYLEDPNKQLIDHGLNDKKGAINRLLGNYSNIKVSYFRNPTRTTNFVERITNNLKETITNIEKLQKQYDKITNYMNENPDINKVFLKDFHEIAGETLKNIDEYNDKIAKLPDEEESDAEKWAARAFVFR